MKPRIIVILTILCLSASLARGQNSMVDAVQKYSDNDFKGAAEMFRSIISAEPDNDAAWYYYGLCELSLGNRDGLEMLRKAAALDTANYWYKDRLAVSYAATGQTELAISMYEELLKAQPKNADLHYALVNLYMQSQEPEKAISSIGEIEAMMGKTDGTVMTKFNILSQLGKNEEAYNSLKEYCEEYSSPYVLTMLGDYEIGMYSDSTALKYYNEALAIDKDYAPARIGIAETYRMTRKYPDYFKSLQAIMEDTKVDARAKGDYMSALMNHIDARFGNNFRNEMDSVVDASMQTHPEDTSLLQTAGIWYYRTGRGDMAKNAFRKSMELRPENLTAAVEYLQVLNAVSDWDALADEGVKAFGRFPQETGFLEMANVGEYNRQNYEAIINNCTRIIDAAQGDSAKTLSAYSSLGDMYHLTGKPQLAYRAYDKALDINPDYAPVLNNYAYYLSEENKSLKKAYKMSKKTVEQEPDNATYLDTFGWILHLMGKDMEAKPFFKHAMLYGGKESATILLHYAAVLDALGENDLAKVYRNQAKNKSE